MNHLDLFSGIGGFSLAADYVWGKDHNITAFVEQDKYCQQILNKHWPNVPIISDIKEFRYDTNTEGSNVKGECKQRQGEGQYRGLGSREQGQTIDLLTGGFPCQPFSVAGKRKGKADDRYLWHEMLRVIQEAKPTWIIGENVSGIINMGLETTVTDLEADGYEVEVLVLPACGVGALHKRDRCWILAHSAGAFIPDTINSTDRTEHGQKGEKDKVQGAVKPEGFSRKPCRTDTYDSHSVSNTEGSAYREDIRVSGRNIKNIGKGREMGDDVTDICEPVSDTAEQGLEGREQNRNAEKENSRRETRAYGMPRQCGNTERGEKRTAQSRLGGMADGVSIWMDEPDIPRVATGIKDRAKRLKALGNAIVPQVVIPIMEGIKLIEERR